MFRSIRSIIFILPSRFVHAVTFSIIVWNIHIRSRTSTGAFGFPIVRIIYILARFVPRCRNTRPSASHGIRAYRNKSLGSDSVPVAKFINIFFIPIGFFPARRSAGGQVKKKYSCEMNRLNVVHWCPATFRTHTHTKMNGLCPVSFRRAVRIQPREDYSSLVRQAKAWRVMREWNSGFF